VISATPGDRPLFPSDNPMFTDFTAVNLGIPKNTEVPFYTENAPDSFGYTANPAGPSFTDQQGCSTLYTCM
jgi:hypothetical protein